MKKGKLLIPPSMTLKELLEDRQISIEEFVKKLNWHPVTSQKLLEDELPLTHKMSEDIERITGVPGSFWFNLYANYFNELCGTVRGMVDV